MTGFLPLVAIGLGISLIINFIGRAVWEATPGGDDLLFSDLMLWGWLKRVHTERKLNGARALLLEDGGENLKPGAKMDVLKDLASSLESRDPYTHGHSRRVARYATMIAKKMDLPANEVHKVRTAAAVHDVGKLEIPLSVLNKPGRLTDEEFDVIKTHAPLGAEMVADLGDRELTEMVAHHHERLDGSGYPSRLAGTDIPLGARIIAVADTFDALTSTRAYRSAKRHKAALGILHSEAGTQLDPLVVSAFDRCYAGSFGGLTAWALLAGLPHRLWAPLESQIHAVSGTAMSKTMTVLATTAATGGIAVSSSTADPRDTSTMPGDSDATSVQRTASVTSPSPSPADASRGFAEHRADKDDGRYAHSQESKIRGGGLDNEALTRGDGHVPVLLVSQSEPSEPVVAPADSPSAAPAASGGAADPQPQPQPQPEPAPSIVDGPSLIAEPQTTGTEARSIRSSRTTPATATAAASPTTPAGVTVAASPRTPVRATVAASPTTR